jgi:hypothetical protein
MPLRQRRTTVAPIPAQTFSGITPAQFSVLEQKAGANGLDLKGHSGTAAKFGVEVAWNYAPETGELSIQCLSAPFFKPPESVNARIKALVKQTIEQTIAEG